MDLINGVEMNGQLFGKRYDWIYILYYVLNGLKF